MNDPRSEADESLGTEEFDPVLGEERSTGLEEFDSVFGIVADGLVGAAGGLVGTATMTVVLLIVESLGAFSRESFAQLALLIGLEGFLTLRRARLPHLPSGRDVPVAAAVRLA